MRLIGPMLVMAFSSVLAALGQLSLKLGSARMTGGIAGIVRNHLLLIGIALYVCATFASIVALRGGELTVLYPIASLNYVWVSVLSRTVLGESMPPIKWIGVACIVVGVMIIL